MEWIWTPTKRSKAADVAIGLGHVVVGAVTIRALLAEVSVLLGVIGLLFALAAWVIGVVISEESL